MWDCLVDPWCWLRRSEQKSYFRKNSDSSHFASPRSRTSSSSSRSSNFPIYHQLIHHLHFLSLITQPKARPDTGVARNATHPPVPHRSPIPSFPAKRAFFPICIKCCFFKFLTVAVKMPVLNPTVRGASLASAFRNEEVWILLWLLPFVRIWR